MTKAILYTCTSGLREELIILGAEDVNEHDNHTVVG